MLRNHPESNPDAVSQIFQKELKSPDNSWLVFTNADVAQAYARAKIKNPDHAFKEAKSIVVVTDNFPINIHLFWLIPCDYLVVPNQETLASAYSALTYWDKMWPGQKPPKIVVNSFPIHPTHEEAMPTELQKNRRQALDSYDFTKPQAAFLLGGASVQAEYMQILVKQSCWWLQPYSVLRNHIQTRSLQDAITSVPKGRVDLVSDNNALIQALNQRMSENPPDIIVVKPGELSNLARLPTDSRGGGQLFFTHPVGNQEKQNIEYLRRKGLMLSEFDGQKLIQDFKGKTPTSPGKILYWSSQSRRLRAIRLPDDPYQAARFMNSLYHHQILHKVHMDNQHLEPPIGATRFWKNPEIFS